MQVHNKVRIPTIFEYMHRDLGYDIDLETAVMLSNGVGYDIAFSLGELLHDLGGVEEIQRVDGRCIIHHRADGSAEFFTLQLTYKTLPVVPQRTMGWIAPVALFSEIKKQYPSARLVHPIETLAQIPLDSTLWSAGREAGVFDSFLDILARAHEQGRTIRMMQVHRTERIEFKRGEVFNEKRQ